MSNVTRRGNGGRYRPILLGLLLLVLLVAAAVHAAVDRERISDQLASAAMDHGMLKTAELLLRASGHPIDPDRFLTAAVLANDAEQADRFLQAGAYPNRIGPGGKPLVYMAAENGFEAVLQVLSFHGADLDFHPGKVISRYC